MLKEKNKIVRFSSGNEMAINTFRETEGRKLCRTYRARSETMKHLQNCAELGKEPKV